MSDSHPRLHVVATAAAQTTDAELCAAFAKGDDAAFTPLVRRHHEVVYAVVRRYVESADEARELTQRAFVKGFQALRRPWMRLGGFARFPFRAWILRIAINLGKNQARQGRRWRAAPLAVLEQAAGNHPSPLEVLERSERERVTREAILQLPPRQQQVLTLRIDSGLPFAEVAAALGITENNAKVHFHHAARRLRELVAPRMDEEI